MKRLNNKGFGHLEILTVVLVVALVAVAGYFVYQHHNKNSVAHAGSYNYETLVNSNGTILQACKQAGSEQTTINALLTLSGMKTGWTYSFGVGDYIGPITGTRATTSGDLSTTSFLRNGKKGLASLQFNVYHHTANYLQFGEATTHGASGGVGAVGGDYRVEKLNNC